MPQETLETVSRYRVITAAAVLQQQVDLRAYPHRHLAVVVYAVGRDTMAQALAAADLLSHQGWELINVTPVGSSNALHVFLRRR
ncbi:transcriptional regulator [Micromonospora sp. NPDC049044]|uniref:transcriptional regulator n=1 Tax=unclassified Micromonospora TaxID=2617518 RepID=UPI0033E8AF39